MTQLLLSADDRTGALEVGGLVANERFTVPVGPQASSSQVCVVDIASRHLEPAAAQLEMAELLSTNAAHRAHKMDAGLRGNWAFEIQVLLDAGYKVAVVCAFPDAGRRCENGIVYIHDLPVLDSVFGQDPLNAPVSSKPAEVLEHCAVRGDVVVWDANDNAEMAAAIARCRSEDRVLVGAAGALGAYADTFFSARHLAAHEITLPQPRLVLCGSLNPLSREQISRLDLQTRGIDEKLSAITGSTLVATPAAVAAISPAAAEATAARAAQTVRDVWSQIGTLIVLGGDTAAAVVGDDTLQAVGMVAPGIPASSYQGVRLITKGGGIGQPDTIKELLARSG